MRGQVAMMGENVMQSKREISKNSHKTSKVEKVGKEIRTIEKMVKMQSGRTLARRKGRNWI